MPARRLDPQSLQVDLFVRRIERAAFHPAVADVRVLDQAVAVGVGGRGEAIRLDDRRPRTRRGMRDRRWRASSRRGRSRTAASHRRWPTRTETGEPRHERRALRDLVRDLAVLRAGYRRRNVERRARGRRSRRTAVSRQRRPQRVAAEEPGEAGPLAVARGAKAGDQTGAERAGWSPALCRCRPCAQSNAVLRRASGVVDAQRVAIEPLVVFRGALVQRRDRAEASGRRPRAPPRGPRRCRR